MDIYDSTYTQYVALMNQLKESLLPFADLSIDKGKKEKVLKIISLVDDTIFNANQKTFLPSNELLAITSHLSHFRYELRTMPPSLRLQLTDCFKHINGAALALLRITNDRAAQSVRDLSAAMMH